MEEWKIERRKKRCSLCNREFASEEAHYSGILEVAAPAAPAPQAEPTAPGFQRRDYCIPCWSSKSETLFSFWQTRMPKREERRIEDIQAMVEFMKRLLAAPSEDPMRRKITYLTALILMRKRRLKLVGQKSGRVSIEKSWDGETVEIVDPPIGPAEVDALKLEMEKLFEFELTREDITA